MGLACKISGHKWSGCLCERCGQTRDAGHFWDGCRCRRCGRVRDELHDWDGDKCARCGKKREVSSHKLDLDLRFLKIGHGE